LKYGAYLSRPPGDSGKPEDLVTLARAAERLGFDSIWMGDHIVWPRRYDAAPHARDVGGDEEGPVQAPAHLFEPLTTLSFLAATVERMRLGVGVLVTPYRNPILCAKMLATLDVLSRGRLVVGVGTGWMREEFELVSAPPYEDRGAVTDEFVRLFIELWTKEVPEFQGRYARASQIVFSPKPIQQPHPPIWIGGNGAIAMKRVAAYGNGWMPLNQTPAQMATKTRQLRSIVEAGGRNPDEIGVAIGCRMRFSERSGRHGGDHDSLLGTSGEMIDQLRRYQEAGVDEVRLISTGAGYADVPELVSAWGKFADEVATKV
jgi:probable F420-dependent oxidoreductase